MTTSPLADDIRARAVQCRRPDGSRYLSLSLTDALDLARRTGSQVRALEIEALKLKVLPERYARNTQTLSLSDQQTLAQSCAGIVGAGGLGGTVAEVLARIGVGRLRLIDGDRFEEHNLNRQRFAHTDNLGRNKARAGKTQIERINPAVEVTDLAVFLDASNADELIGDANVVIDCLDQLDARLVLQKACRRQEVPLVSAAVAGTSGQLTVIFPGDAGLENLIGDIAADETRGVETRLGNLPFAVSTLASLEAAEAVKILLGQNVLLRNRLLIFDLVEPYFEIIQLA
ncbi:MAG: HesA/MoeB/ThiF family protein [Desulfobacterales bacterium]|jgi:molybdopterin/thiamine biosynthesis adenylyltransferase